jgi:hypothetical protein
MIPLGKVVTLRELKNLSSARNKMKFNVRILERGCLFFEDNVYISQTLRFQASYYPNLNKDEGR